MNDLRKRSGMTLGDLGEAVGRSADSTGEHFGDVSSAGRQVSGSPTLPSPAISLRSEQSYGVPTLDQAMDEAGVRHTTELYEGAQHGYTMSDMGAYNEAAAERHFTALFALLQKAIRR